MKLTVRREGEVAFIELEGDIGDQDLDRLDHAIGRVEDLDLVVDLEAVDYMNSQVISVLLAGWQSRRRSSRGFAIAAPQGMVRDVLQATGIPKFVTVASSVEAALADLKPTPADPSAETDEVSALIMMMNGLDPDDMPRMVSLRKTLQDGAALEAWPSTARARAVKMVEKIDWIIFDNAQNSAEIFATLPPDLDAIRRILKGEDVAEIVDLTPIGAAGTGAPGTGEGGESQPFLALDPEMMAEGVTESLENLDAAEEALMRLERESDDSEALNQVFRSFHSIKGFAGFAGATHLGRFAHLAETMLDHARQGQIRIVGMTADMVLQAVDVFRVMLRALAAGTVWTETARDVKVREFLEAHKIVHHSLDDAIAGGAIAGGAAVGASTAPVETIAADMSARSDVAAVSDTSRPSPVTGAAPETSIRISTDRLDRLVNIVGEMVIGQAMVEQESDVIRSHRENTTLHANIVSMGKSIRELQDISMSLRMVPLAATFQRMTRLVRDIARKVGKEIHFVTTGEETEIDRLLVEQIAEPLVHMVRNAVDHGIESPEERIDQGKVRTGEIHLSARHESGFVMIELRDDGKGMDPDTLQAKAVEKNLIPADRVLSRREALDLVFLPGFSTAQTVTDLSGRGVGMDVVRTNLQKISGDVSLESTLGEGSTLTLRIPLTMAIIEGMLVRVGPINYTIPLLSISETMAAEADQVTRTADGQEFFRMRDHLYPIIRLHKLHAIEHAEHDLEKGILILLSHKSEEFCLFVDQIIGQQQTVVKALSPYLGRVRAVTSCSILGTGEISLILDVQGLHQLAGTSDEVEKRR